MIQIIGKIACLGLYIFFFSRTRFGNRNKEQRWPQWMEKLGDRDIPRLIGSDWFFWIAWISRRCLPVVSAIAFVALWDYLTGHASSDWLSGPEWLVVVSLAVGFFTAYMPFAKRPRRNPLDKWMSMSFGLLYTISGFVMAVIALAVHYTHFSPDSHSTIGHVTQWAVSASLGDALSLAGGIIGYGVVLIAMAEVLPNWRTKVFVVDHSEELKRLQAHNQQLAAEVHKLRKKLRGHSPRRHR